MRGIIMIDGRVGTPMDLQIRFAKHQERRITEYLKRLKRVNVIMAEERKKWRKYYAEIEM